MKYQHLFEEIAKIAGLYFKDDILIEYSGEQRQGFLVAMDAAVLLEESQGKKLFQPVDKSMADLLGDYFPAEKKIVIYEKVCRSTADVIIHAPYETLEYVVAAHEISHAVTHLGEERFPGSGIIWDSYPHADLWDKELFAQLYPFFHFLQHDEQEALEVFQKLSTNQLPIYTSWQLYRHIPLNEINELLSLTRQKRFCAWIALDPIEAQSENSTQP